MERIYDMIIIGGGPAGLSAGIYGGRAKLDVLVIEKESKAIANLPKSTKRGRRAVVVLPFIS